jgi:hypothetical protein
MTGQQDVKVAKLLAVFVMDTSKTELARRKRPSGIR